VAAAALLFSPCIAKLANSALWLTSPLPATCWRGSSYVIGTASISGTDISVINLGLRLATYPVASWRAVKYLSCILKRAWLSVVVAARHQAVTDILLRRY